MEEHVAAVGSVIQLLINVISVLRSAIVCCILPGVLYVPVQLAAVGSVMHVLIIVTSPDVFIQVEPSHLEARTAGIAAALPYTILHSEEVGSVMQAFTAIKSTLDVETPPKDSGTEPAAPYVARHEDDVGSAIHCLSGVTSVPSDATAAGKVVTAPYDAEQAAAVGFIMQDLTIVSSAADEET